MKLRIGERNSISRIENANDVSLMVNVAISFDLAWDPKDQGRNEIKKSSRLH